MSSMEWDYARWTEGLADHFFSAEFAGEPVTFSVDPGSLATITGDDAATAIESLGSVVRRIVMPNHRFHRVRDMARTWCREGCDGPPPSLPLLALTVLAVTTADNFGLYKPLRRLLDPDDGASGMPGDFDDAVPEMWEQLTWWLDDHLQGRHGVSTITKHSFYRNIGYSAQQAVLRPSDRTLIYRFFKAIGLSPGEEEVVPSELRRALGAWAGARLPRTKRLHRLATDASHVPYAEALLHTLASRWDGRLRSERTGSIAAPLRLMLELRPVGLSFIARRRDSDPIAIVLETVEGEVLDLRGHGAIYEPFPLGYEVSSSALRDGVELSGQQLSLFHEASSVVPFAYDVDLQEWVSVDRITFDEKHHLLVHADVRLALQEWLATEGCEGALDPNATKQLPNGWFLFRNVRVVARPEHEPPAGVRDLLGSIGGGARLRLVGGLKVHGLGRTYLTGGGPNVAVPPGSDDLTIEIRHEGYEPLKRTASGHEFLMSALDLGEGSYEVRHGGTSLRFAMIESVKATPGLGVGAVRTGRSTAAVSGLLTDRPTARPIAVPALAEGPIIVVGPVPGDTALVDPPLWFAKLAGGLSWTSTDVWCGFEPAWILVPTSSRSEPLYIAHPLRVVPPAGGEGSPSWSGLIRSSAPFEGMSSEQLDTWHAYVDAASSTA